MPIDFYIFPFRFSIDTIFLGGITLWALAFYLALFPVSERIANALSRWFSFAERSLYNSAEEFERTRAARESQNDFYGSLFSIIPFIAVGGLFSYLMEIGLGRSWSISMGIIAAIGCGIYELGRRSTQ